MKYQELSPKPNFSEIQPETLGFWMENKVFESDPVKLAAMQAKAAEEMEAEKAAKEAEREEWKAAEVASGEVVEAEGEEVGDGGGYDGDGFAVGGGYGGYGPDEMPPEDSGSMYFQ